MGTGDQRKASMTATERQVLDRFKAALHRSLDVADIILFGSRARGDAEEFSDMDVIVVIEGEVDRRVRDLVSDAAWEAGFEAGIVMVPVVFPRSEWESDAVRYSLLGRAVAQEGVPL
jgi:uncharacterized protein